MIVFAGIAVFIGASLLFLVQPILAKMILPWFGGAAGVWAVCLFFFQTTLLLGYLYAHALIRYVTARWQPIVHSVLLAASLAWLPILRDERWKPAGSEDPSWRILALLAATVGAPYLLLASTSPLMQAWMARTGAVPYRLFAVSNVASLAGLLAYPFVVEPFSTTRWQGIAWSIAYGLYAVLAAAAAWRLRGGAVPTQAAAEPRPRWSQLVHWAVLAAIASATLLAFTNHLTQNVAAVPFLWILPLSAYLLTFILCFDRESTARWRWWPWFTGISLMLVSALQLTPQTDLKVAVPLFVLALFFICMYLHGRLARLKPHPEHLTLYFLMISAGGAVGALLVSVAAPSLFREFVEMPLVILVTGFILFFGQRQRSWALNVRWIIVAITTAVGAFFWIQARTGNFVDVDRNFYGVLKVTDAVGGTGQMERTLLNGVIKHGTQILTDGVELEATAYYSSVSAVGRALQAIGRPGRRIGAVGLGAGTLAVYGRPGDVFRFYEINPLSIQFAREYFRYVPESKATVEIELGDARLTLERESPQEYDLIALDAFSGDSIPVHLLTTEAFQLYLSHLRADGILAIHISNQHLSLAPLVESVARSVGLKARRVLSAPPETSAAFRSEWVLVARDEAWAAYPRLADAGESIPPSAIPPWTDDYSNLLLVLR